MINSSTVVTIPRLEQKTYGTGIKSYSGKNQNKTIGCLLEVISDTSGFICGDDEHLYFYNIDSMDNVNKKQLTPSTL